MHFSIKKRPFLYSKKSLFLNQTLSTHNITSLSPYTKILKRIFFKFQKINFKHFIFPSKKKKYQRIKFYSRIIFFIFIISFVNFTPEKINRNYFLFLFFILFVFLQKKTHTPKNLETLYTFAEFGTLSSGFFHDLVNPFQALLLHVESLKKQSAEYPPKLSQHIEKTYTATKKLEKSLFSIRTHLEHSQTNTNFLLSQEIFEAMDLLKHKAQHNNVDILFLKNTPILYYGNKSSFQQIVVNLLSNGVDAYDESLQENKKIHIELTCKNQKVKLLIQDFGRGIPDTVKPYIFEPLFTTKKDSKGLGIGLCMVKYQVEKNLGGTIHFFDNKPHGTCFLVEFDIKK